MNIFNPQDRSKNRIEKEANNGHYKVAKEKFIEHAEKYPEDGDFIYEALRALGPHFEDYEADPYFAITRALCGRFPDKAADCIQDLRYAGFYQGQAHSFMRPVEDEICEIAAHNLKINSHINYTDDQIAAYQKETFIAAFEELRNIESDKAAEAIAKLVEIKPGAAETTLKNLHNTNPDFKISAFKAIGLLVPQARDRVLDELADLKSLGSMKAVYEIGLNNPDDRPKALHILIQTAFDTIDWEPKPYHLATEITENLLNGWKDLSDSSASIAIDALSTIAQGGHKHARTAISNISFISAQNPAISDKSFDCLLTIATRPEPLLNEQDDDLRSYAAVCAGNNAFLDGYPERVEKMIHGLGRLEEDFAVNRLQDLARWNNYQFGGQVIDLLAEKRKIAAIAEIASGSDHLTSKAIRTFKDLNSDKGLKGIAVKCFDQINAADESKFDDHAKLFFETGKANHAIMVSHRQSNKASLSAPDLVKRIDTLLTLDSMDLSEQIDESTLRLAVTELTQNVMRNPAALYRTENSQENAKQVFEKLDQTGLIVNFSAAASFENLKNLYVSQDPPSHNSGPQLMNPY